VALREFFRQPAPRDFRSAAPEVQRFWNEYMGSALLARRIIEGIVVVPVVIFLVVQVVQLARGRAWLGDVVGYAVGIGLGVGLLVILPTRLFFRSIQRRNRRRMDGLAAGQLWTERPRLALPIMHGDGDGHRNPAWRTWVELPDAGPRPFACVVFPRADDLPAPEEVDIIVGPTGDALVLWEPGGICAIVPAEQRHRSMPPAQPG